MAMEETAPGGVAARVILTLLGAAGIIVGSLLSWLSFGQLGDLAEQLGQELPKTAGIKMQVDVFWSPFTEDPTGASFFGSAGLITLIIGVIALLGLVAAWLARVGGVLAIVAFVLYLITLFRSPDQTGLNFGFGSVGIGMWLILVGGILSVIGGFFLGRRIVMGAAAAPPPPMDRRDDMDRRDVPPPMDRRDEPPPP